MVSESYTEYALELKKKQVYFRSVLISVCLNFAHKSQEKALFTTDLKITRPGLHACISLKEE